MKANEYESIDRDMSSWVVSTVHQGTRFYLFSNAKRFRWSDQADMAAEHAMADLVSWSWKAVRVAEVMAVRGSK